MRSAARPILHARTLALVVLAAELGLASCSATDVVAICGASRCGRVDPPDASPSDAGPRDAGTTDGGSLDGGDFCSGSGPVLLVGDTPGGVACTGAIAANTFRYAVCTCGTLNANVGLTVDAFNSARGPYTPGTAGGSVGANGNFLAGEPVVVGGSLFVAGPTGVSVHTNGRLDVGLDAHVASTLDSSGDVRIGRDLFVGGRLQTESADVAVTGTLTQTDLTNRSVDGALTSGGEVMAEVTVEPPCGCEPSDLIDVNGYVERHRDTNDDARIGLDPAALASFDGPLELELPCGRYFVDAIGGNGKLTIRVTGRAALFVAGDVRTNDDFEVTVEGDGELDLFIGGIIVAGAGLRLGSESTPAKVRVYVGGSDAIMLGAGILVAGNLYAPTAELTSAAMVEVYGSLFAESINANSPVVVHYDTAVLNAGAACPPTSATCTDACDCGQSACVDGTCGACVTDGDCCAPLLCNFGRCDPIPF